MKTYLAALLVFVSIPALAQAPQPPAQKEAEITITLPVSQYQRVMGLVAKQLPWDEANPIMMTMGKAWNEKYEELQKSPANPPSKEP